MWAGSAPLIGPDSALKDVGPDSAQKGLGRSRPNNYPPLVWAGPGLDRRFGPEWFWTITNISGPELVWPREEESLMGGELFSPPHLLHAERLCMQEAKKTMQFKNLGGGSIPGAVETMACWRCSLMALRWRSVAPNGEIGRASCRERVSPYV